MHGATLVTDGPFPKLDTPFVQPSRSGEPAESGRIIAVPWYRLLITFWNRTGGSLGGVLLARNNLSDVDSAVTSADNLSTRSVDIASAPTTDLGLATGTYVIVTGNTNISSFGIAPVGVKRVVRFTNVLTLVYNAASMILQGAGDLITAAGDVGEFVSQDFGNWRQIGWFPATKSGSGAEVYATSPTLVTPNIGAASGTSLNLSGLSASAAVATDAGNNLVSVANTGTGNNVLATSPTLTTPNIGVASATSVNFGGTTLSSYDAFTFTVTAAFATPGTSSWAYTTQTGRGVKIGRIAQMSIDFNGTPTIGTGSGTVMFSGFPYTGVGQQTIIIGNMGNTWTWPAGRTQVAGNMGGGSSFSLRSLGSAVSTSDFAASNMTGGSAHAFRASAILEAV